MGLAKIDGRDVGVSWDEAEEALMLAVEYLGALPDRERGFLSAGRRSGWPQVLRIEQSDYPDRPSPRMRMGQREMAHLEAMLLGPDAAVLAVPEEHRRLLGLALVAKRWPGAGGFRWDGVRERMGGRAKGVPSGDALRMRYDRAVAKVAGAMGRAR